MSNRKDEFTIDDPRLTAYALGELEGEELRAAKEFVAANPEAQEAVEEIRACTAALEAELAIGGEVELTPAQRDAIDERLAPAPVPLKKRNRFVTAGAWLATAAAVVVFLRVFLPPNAKETIEPYTYGIFGEAPDRTRTASLDSGELTREEMLDSIGYVGSDGTWSADVRDVTYGLEDMSSLGLENGATGSASQNAAGNPTAGAFHEDGGDGAFVGTSQNFFGEEVDLSAFMNAGESASLRTDVEKLYDLEPLAGLGYADGESGGEQADAYFGYVPGTESTGGVRPVLKISQGGSILAKRESYYDPEQSDAYKALTKYLLEQAVAKEKGLRRDTREGAPEIPDEVLLLRADCNTSVEFIQKVKEVSGEEQIKLWKLQLAAAEPATQEELHDNESYASIIDNPFMDVLDDSLSTFSIDVDTAAYSNVRRHLLANSKLPPADAVRIEELINYFPYDYPSPGESQPFSVNVEVAAAPWQPKHRLVKIGLKGREPIFAERKNANLVFLLDVSGSMDEPMKLPLLVEALTMLVKSLDPTDRVAIVVYAGSSGLVLDSTSCSEKPLILSALERLDAGGSTNGGAGIQLAYDVARRNYVDGGINRVILATDGDFNVGTTSQSALEELITEKAKGGVFLSVLGFGSGNLKDSTMEMLADKGNGNYSYIDSTIEARKVLVEQMGGTLVAIAKDVKIQIEFNPAEAQAFRLIGYENRILAHQDFNDDTKDAGEIGSGHTVTALYEVVPVGVEFNMFDIDPLRYQKAAEQKVVPTEAANSGELLTLKLRYKEPEGSVSKKIVHAVMDKGAEADKPSADFHFAASVASFGMLLRNSKYKGGATWETTLDLAKRGLGEDQGGYRLEYQYLVQRASALSR